MKEKNKPILEKAIKQLPESKVDNRIWDKIDQQLDNEVIEKNPETLKKSIRQLPSFSAKEDTWSKIEKELDRTSNPANKFYLHKIAASVILAIGLSILANNILTRNTYKDKITFSQETLPYNAIDISSLALEKELNDLIQQQCLIQPDYCRSPVFTELKEELSGLTKSLDEIKMVSKNSMNDPETYKYILQIHKEMAEVSKKILQFLNS